MGILQKLKSALGLGGNGGRPTSGEAGVHVEREPSAETERAVKEGAASAGGGATTETPRAPRSAGGTDSASEGDEVASDAADADTPNGASADAAEQEADAGDADADDADADDEDGTNDATASPGVETVNGIGPTYAERLSAAGIESVGDLADSDAETVAEAAQTSPSRVQDWLEQARDS